MLSTRKDDEHLVDTEQLWSERFDFSDTAQFPLIALEILAAIPTDGTEEERLVGQFADTLRAMVADPEKQTLLFAKLLEINPNYQPKLYSQDAKANVLANVVAAIYAPLIHAFTGSVLKNIQAGILSPVVIAPPRDGIPFANSIKAQADLKGVAIKVIDLQVTRKVAGISNQQGQNGHVSNPDPLLEEYIAQELGPYFEQGFTEIEPGIYSTTSMVTAGLASKMGNEKYTALKLYGLGPNLSFVHAILSGGQEWVAERAESQGLVDPGKIANLMTLLDSTEEFGMQHMHASVSSLKRNEQGLVKPDIRESEPENLAIAIASNLAITDTAEMYSNNELALQTATSIIDQFDEIVALANQGFPLCLTSLIPPGKIDNKITLFEKIRSSKLLNLPSGLNL
ncbi:hypothetical protein KJZ63_00420 [Patescibacteria group bacterium]|nr:hypothetical protein [Patescibacteria group bacterium]